MSVAATVTLSSDDPDITVSALLDAAGVTVSGGYGGWEVITRPRRQGVTHWGGRDPFRMDMALILDEHASYGRVETDCSRLERLALPHPNPGGSPPVISISGAAVPHDDIKEWVVEGIEWGETIRDKQGYRTRQHVVIGLLRYVQVDKIQVTAAANARNQNGGGGVRTVDVRQGDTLVKIAARYLGYGHLWKKIAALNPPLRDPNALLKIERVKIPPKDEK
jgi:hypothetical protein